MGKKRELEEYKESSSRIWRKAEHRNKKTREVKKNRKK